MTPTTPGYAALAAASTVLLALAWWRPRAARVVLAFAFAAAATFHVVTALRAPQRYVRAFAALAFPPMNELVERILVLAPDAVVAAIAVAQALIALALGIGRGPWLRAGVVGAATFLGASSWLGAGAAFPVNLVLTAAALLLLRAPRRP